MTPQNKARDKWTNFNANIQTLWKKNTLWWKYSHQWSPVLCLCHNPSQEPPRWNTNTHHHSTSGSAGSAVSPPALLTNSLIITFLPCCQAYNQWIPRPAFALHLHLYWGLYGAALLRYIKTAAPWSNEQIPPGSAKGYPTSVNNAAFKHQSYAKRLVHRGGDGRQEKAETQGLDWRDNERGSTQENISSYLTLLCQLLHSFMMKI